MSFHLVFRKSAQAVANAVGSPWSFALAVAAIIGWAAVGPACHFSNTWQLVINTGTTICTFLMVFLIQNTQNRESSSMQLKLDELIRATHSARDRFLDVENASDDDLRRLFESFRDLSKRAEIEMEKRRGD